MYIYIISSINDVVTSLQTHLTSFFKLLSNLYIWKYVYLQLASNWLIKILKYGY
jgi:hypothetical protein